MGRVVVAGIVAGIVMFVWEAVAHMALPLGNMGLQIPPQAQQEAVLSAMRANFGEEGIYLLPMMQMDQWGDAAASTAFGQYATTQPYAFVAYQPQGIDSVAGMGKNLGIQALTDVLAGLIAAFVASAAGLTRGRRILIVTAMGLFATLSCAWPQWNWYRFATDFVIAASIMQIVGWLLAGIAVAFVLRTRAISER